ncbi:hypothetical protein PINS_up001446 [Pythium insidiosum]|nr:hypothetical protein PINS_up001446 [Pythium insidiosum]
MIIPTLVLKPYYDAYIPESYSFELALFYDEVWFANLVMELRFLFSTSLLDVLSKLVPHLAVLSCLSNIKLLVKRADAPKQSAAVLNETLASRSNKRQRAENVRLSVGGRTDAQDSNLTANNVGEAINASGSLWRSKVGRAFFNKSFRHGCHMLMQVIFLVWGVMLLVIHVVAVSRRPSSDLIAEGCRKTMQPWLVQHKACLVLEYNCYRRGVTTLEPGVFEAFDKNTLAALLFTHCPALTITKSIHHFPNVLGIEVYNSTLVRWGPEAAVTSQHYNSMMYLFYIRTQMQGVPEGLLQPIPQSLIDIEFSVTNLTTLPDNIDSLWAPMLTLFIEYSNFTRIPEPVLRLPIGDLSFIGNQLTQLPEFSSSGSGFFVLSLANNPITTLPHSLMELPVLGVLNVIDTQIASLPSWMDELVQSKSTQVLLKDTPFCRSKSEAEIVDSFGVDARISCVYTDDRTSGRCPLNLTIENRPL